VEGRLRDRAEWGALLCLRLAVLIHRSRSDGTSPPLELHVTPKRFALGVEGPWLESNPLTDYALEGEVEEWKKVGFTLDILARVWPGIARGVR
jgi:exopolyphosphatase/guanosine-5'-triphosphate,3'-diphosphate pyrophosphatase